MRKERRHGRNEGKRGGRKLAEEGGSNGVRERSKRGAWEEGTYRLRGRETSRDVS